MDPAWGLGESCGTVLGELVPVSWAGCQHSSVDPALVRFSCMDIPPSLVSLHRLPCQPVPATVLSLSKRTICHGGCHLDFQESVCTSLAPHGFPGVTCHLLPSPASGPFPAELLQKKVSPAGCFSSSEEHHESPWSLCCGSQGTLALSLHRALVTLSRAG